MMVTGILGECQAIFSRSKVCLKITFARSPDQKLKSNAKVKIDLFEKRDCNEKVTEC